MCELCEQENLRYQYEIRNAFTQKRLLVGSQCILRFGMSVFEDGQKLSPADAKKKLDHLMEQMRQDACVRALEAPAVAENSDLLKNALAYFRRTKHLSPKYAALVLWRLQQNGIDHNPSFFKVSIRRGKHKADLKSLNPAPQDCVAVSHLCAEAVRH